MIIFLSLVAIFKVRLIVANLWYQKCCPDGEAYNLQKKCEKLSNFRLNGFNLSGHTNDSLIGNKCYLSSLVYHPDEVLLLENGSILIDSNTLIDTNGYCVERLEFFNYSIAFLVCHTVGSSGPKIDIYLLGNDNK